MSMQASIAVRDRNSVLSPSERTKMIKYFVDELIPGSENWPSASDAGVHGIVALRIFAEWTEEQTMALADQLGWQSDGLSSGDSDMRISAVKAFEAADPDLFDKIYTAVTLAYYETPFVIEAIQNTGRTYSYRPHVTGYKMEPFDFNRDTPRHGRGHYLKTNDVAPVDTSAIDLDTVKTAEWGVKK